MEDPPKHYVRRRHLAAFGLLVAVLVGSSMLNRSWIESHLEDARVLNLAGRHRMLTQRILLLEEVSRRARTSGDTRAGQRATSLHRRALNRLNSDHMELFHPNGTGIIQGLLGPDELSVAADEEVHSFLLLAPETRRTWSGTEAPEEDLFRTGESVLSRLEELVAANEERSRAQLERLHGVQAVLLGTKVLLLVGLALLLIRPMELRIRGQFESLRALNRRLEERNIELEKSRGKGAFLAAIVDSSEDAIVGQTLDGRITSWNSGAEDTYGYGADRVLGRRFALLLPDDRAAEATDLLERMRAGEHVRNHETVHLRADGQRIHVSLTISPIKDAQGRVVGASIIARDIDRKIRIEEELRELNLALVEAMPGIARLGEDGVFLHMNATFADLVGVTSEQLVGMPWDVAIHPDDESHARQAYAKAQHSEKAEFEARIDAGGFGLFLFVPRIGPDGSPNGHHLLLRDVSERRRAEEQLRHEAYHDALTGLPNRTLLFERLERCYARTLRGKGATFAVLFLDLDRFKVINDSCGHETGDELLRQVARSLEDCVRPEDTVARMGGDEFAVLVADVGSARGASRVARRVLRQLEHPFQVGDREFFTSASIGIALSDHCKDGNEILRDADTAMYRAKREGTGRFAVFQPEMHARLLADLELETELRRGVERGELTVHYQPIVSLEDGSVAALEALVRWEHPVRGTLLPGEFLEMAEDTKLIDPIGVQVLGEACRRLEGWRRAGIVGEDVAVNVNVSGTSFRSGTFFDRMDELLNGLEPRCLNLELTENILLDREDVGARLAPLVERGVGTEIDDFGTGYCSLGNLHELPIRGLKIDKSFVHRIEAPQAHRDLVRTIVSLAGALEVRVTAEGVENVRQLDVLRGLGCTRAQGFLFSRPLPAEEMERLLTGELPWRGMVGVG